MTGMAAVAAAPTGLSADDFLHDEIDNRLAIECLQSRKAVLEGELSRLKDRLATVTRDLEALQDQRLQGIQSGLIQPNATDSDEFRRESVIALAKRRFNADPAKGIAVLIEQKIIPNTPEAVADFLAEADQIDKKMLGEYLGEGNEFNIEVLSSFVMRQDFSNMSFDRALRKFLTLFRLPGEAQKIDRMMGQFAISYQKNNTHVFASSDSAYVLAFSLIMVNTDLHNPAIKNKISRDAFVRNNRGINNGEDFPTPLLHELYDSILKEEFRMEEGSLFTTFYNPEREGWLAKQGGRYKSWKKRWFILTGNCLYYFKDPSDTAPCGIIPLENLNVLDSIPDGTTIDKKTRFRFGLQHFNPNKIKAAKTVDGRMVEGHHNEYLFAAETEDERGDWIRSMLANMQKTPGYALMQTKKEKVTMQTQQPIGASSSKNFSEEE